jgi:hypothetical protein
MKLNNLKVWAVLCIAAFAALAGCTRRDDINAKSFVGKWHSSRLTTPVYLHDDGEWEIKTDDGAILQYGVWQYKDRRILWSYKIGAAIGHDVNIVVSATPKQLQLEEADRTVTTFDRID